LRLIAYDEIDSTNDEAKRLVRVAVSAWQEQGAAEKPADSLYGTVITARRQTAGRGRRGRSFVSSGADSIYASFILNPSELPEEQRITAFAAVAVCEAIEKTTYCKPAIKWVNDVLIDGKKICGILAESVPHAVVLGIGVNINMADEDFPPGVRGIAGSMHMDADGRTRFFNALTEAVFRLAGETEDNDTACSTMDEYRSRSILIGQRILIHKGEEKTPALAISIADDGGLIVRYEDGYFDTLRSGEVSVRLL
jgi:BirA family biotin operon repressor/biotin-[acetyl-CoA-carboxylase] ligase